MRRRIIAALTYPRMLMLSRMDLRECPMDGTFTTEQQVCKAYQQGEKCQWLNSNDGFSIMAEQPLEALFAVFEFSIGYVDSHIARDRHNFRYCTCDTCTWAKDARHLVRRYKGQSASVISRSSSRQSAQGRKPPQAAGKDKFAISKTGAVSEGSVIPGLPDRKFLCVVLATFLAACRPAEIEPPPAGLVLRGGTIHPVSATQPRAESIATQDGQFVTSALTIQHEPTLDRRPGCVKLMAACSCRA